MIALELSELTVESQQRLNAIVRRADPFQPKAGWLRPYYTCEAHDDIETAFAVTFGHEACPAARLDGANEPELPFAEDE